ncbi:MAG: hypothetical protein K2J77_01030 [Oscillospiraceae bacterium]|nr:hypothetical protein [Oscillospiraceae bacterium]
MTKFNRMKLFLKSCLLFFSKRAEAIIEISTFMKDGFSMIDNVLYISGKTKIKIKEHFAETKAIALDLVESVIKCEKRNTEPTLLSAIKNTPSSKRARADHFKRAVGSGLC